MEPGIYGTDGTDPEEATGLLEGEDTLEDPRAVQDVLDSIAAVTPDDVRALAAELLVQEPALGVLGPFDQDEAQAWLAS